MSATLLGVPAVRQVLARLSKAENEENALIDKLEKGCIKFDHAKKGALTADEYYNVIKLQNGIGIAKDEVSEPKGCRKWQSGQTENYMN